MANECDVFVTGGTGYMGSRLISTLVGRGRNFSRGYTRRKIRVTIVPSARPDSVTKRWMIQYNRDAKRTRATNRRIMGYRS
ncbi:MAG TPA: hypothetical protein VFN58_03010 [Candidatus Binatia bacterium]|nr:hypothetical protein [Candidatus Binatia bacterium]